MSLQAVTIPGPRTVSMVGWGANLLRLTRDPIGYLTMLYRSYGPIARLSEHGPIPVVFAFGPAYNRQLLSDMELFHLPKFVRVATPEDSAARRMDSSLIGMNGAQHEYHRRLIMPTFHKKQVESYRDDMVERVERMLDRWSIGQSLDITHEMQQLTLSIVCKTLFGMDSLADAERIGVLSTRWLSVLTNGSLMLFPFNLPGTAYRRMLATAEQLDAIYRAIINEKRANPAQQRDVIAMLIQMHDADGGITTDDLVAHAHGLLVAGHETSTFALTWTLFLLSQHPSILADLVDELDGVLKGAAPTIEQLNHLPLLEWVIKESMRVIPIVALGHRVSTGPFELGPHALPQGTNLVYSQYITHHMPELYPDPRRFSPERWRTLTPSPYEYLPFGAGPRMCIGATFAMVEIKIVLAMLLQRYRLALAPGARIDRQVSITVAPKYGMPMLVARQDRQFSRGTVRGNIHEMVDLQ